MTFNLARLPESKRQQRHALAALPTGETLRLPDGLRQHTLDLRGCQPTSSLILRGEPAVPWSEEAMTIIRDHIATSLSVELNDLDYTPFNQEGGLGKAHQLFGDQLPKLLEELNEALAA